MPFGLEGTDTEQIRQALSSSSPDANFADKFVGDEAARHISKALEDNVSKTRVFLDRNCIGAEGAAALGDMLKVGICEPCCRLQRKQWAQEGFGD